MQTANFTKTNFDGAEKGLRIVLAEIEAVVVHGERDDYENPTTAPRWRDMEFMMRDGRSIRFEAAVDQPTIEEWPTAP